MNWQTMLDLPGSADWILLTALHSLWLSFAAYLVMRLMKLRSSVVRSTWGTCTLIALLVLPLITWSIPRLTVSTQTFQETVRGTNMAMVETPVPLMNRLLEIKAPLAQADINQWKARTNQFGVLWLAFTLIGMGRILYQLAFLKGYCTGLQEIRDDRISAILRENNSPFRFRRKPRFFASHKLISPISTGILTPLVILPFNLYRSIGDKELRAILLHELAHIYHHDHFLGLLQRIIKALYWWNPFACTLCNSLSVAREEVSDNYAISGMGSASGYAGLLVNLVEKTALISRLPCTAGMGTPYELLETRIKNIVSKERDMRVKISKRMMWSIPVTATLLCCVVAIGSQVAVFGIGQAPSSGQETNVQQPAPAPGKSTPGALAVVDPNLFKMLVHLVAPIYPERGIQAHVQCRVELDVKVNGEGLVTDARVIKGHPLFSEAAMTAVKQWIFHPSVIAGSMTGSFAPVAPPPKPMPGTTIKGWPFRTTIGIEFHLDENDSPKIAISASEYKFLLKRAEN